MKHEWDVEGYLSADGQAALTTAQNALEEAMKKQNQNLVFLDDNGTETATNLKSGGSIGGVRIIRGPDFTARESAEYATERHFSFSAEAEYPVSGADALLLDWTETIDIEGGGPMILHRPAVNGPPQKQILYMQMPYKATQSGSAKGYRRYPNPPVPLWPAHLAKAPKAARTSPKRRLDNNYEGFGVTWHYEFESAGPLVGTPTLWK